MTYPFDTHRYENYLLEALLEEHIKPVDHSAYFTVLTGLRLRVFEGVITDFLDFRKITYDSKKGLAHKIPKIQTAIQLDNHQQLNELVGILHTVRNKILHGDFNFQIVDQAIWEDLNKFLCLLEDHLGALVEGTPSQINFSSTKAVSLKSKISNLLSA